MCITKRMAPFGFPSAVTAAAMSSMMMMTMVMVMVALGVWFYSMENSISMRLLTLSKAACFAVSAVGRSDGLWQVGM